jgi:hypothetical protein
MGFIEKTSHFRGYELGRAQMARVAFDLAEAEIAFQPLHCSTEAGFGVPEHARSGAKAAMLPHLAKHLPIAPIHWAIVHRPEQGVQTIRISAPAPMR